MCISVNCSQSRIANVCLSVHQSIKKDPQPLRIKPIFHYQLLVCSGSF